MRPTKALYGLPAAIVFFLCNAAVSQSTEIHCPSSVVVQESADLTELQGWRAHDNSVKGIHHFYGVAFSGGPPENLVYQAHSSSTRTKRSKVDVYDLSSVSDDVWISCLYRDTSQSLTQKLPKRFSRCEVTYDAKTGFRSVKKISCF